MSQRCTNPRHKSWSYYGGRRISVCDQWRNDYTAFLAHVGRRPSPKHSLDRIDNDGNYEPGNVRWATKKEQQRNRRFNRYITLNGETLLLLDWAERIGIPHDALRDRLNRNWPIERALTEPVGQWRKQPEPPASSETNQPALEQAGLL
jgi:hypothetical protein